MALDKRLKKYRKYYRIDRSEKIDSISGHPRIIYSVTESGNMCGPAAYVELIDNHYVLISSKTIPTPFGVMEKEEKGLAESRLEKEALKLLEAQIEEDYPEPRFEFNS